MFYKWLIFLSFLPFILLAQTNETTQIYQENNLWGLKGDQPITPAVYDTLIAFDNSTKFIAKKHHASTGVNSVGIISSKGKIIIPFSYLQITPFSNTYIVKVWKNNEAVQGVIDQSNKIILPLRFYLVKQFNNFWITKNKKEGLFIYSKEGEFLKQVGADSVSISENTHFLKVFKGGKIGILDKQLNELFPPKYKTIRNINGQWETVTYPRWQVVAQNDTLVFNADTLKIWTTKKALIKVNDTYSVYENENRIGKTYQAIDVVSSNFAITTKGGLNGAINNRGEEIMPPSFGLIYFAKDFFYAKTNNKWAVYDSLGNKRSVLKYDSIGPISDGLFPIKRKEKWGFMNRDGKEVIHCIYDKEANFKDGKSIITYFGASGIIDLKGNWIVKPKEENIIDFSFNFYIYHKNGLYYLKNYTNDLIYFTRNKLMFRDETIYEIRDGYTSKVSSLGALVNNEPITTEGSDAWQIIKVGNKYGFEDTRGLLKITYRYDSLLPFSEGLAAFKLREKWGYIDESEKIIIQPIYNSVSTFTNNLAVVSANNKSGLVKPDGSFMLKPKFDIIKPINAKLWLVKEKGLKGIYNSAGGIIIQTKYDQIWFLNSNLIIVMRGGKYGIVNAKGQNVVPRIYDYIGFNQDYKILILKYQVD